MKRRGFRIDPTTVLVVWVAALTIATLVAVTGV